MEEIGVVKSIEGITARVVVSRKSSFCESCEKDTCDIPENGIETDAINTAGAKVGQRVKISLNPYTYFKGAMLVYILPVFALIAGAIFGKMRLAPYFGNTDSELIAAIGGFLALFASLILIKIIAARMNRKTEYKSVIESIVEV
jgi:sigma-E factor negative regulatory protein RseC